MFCYGMEICNNLGGGGGGGGLSLSGFEVIYGVRDAIR